MEPDLEGCGRSGAGGHHGGEFNFIGLVEGLSILVAEVSRIRAEAGRHN